MSKIALAVLLGIASSMVGAQTVYKCTKADGSVTFSQSPCGKDAKVVMGNSPTSKDASVGENHDAKSPASQPATTRIADEMRNALPRQCPRPKELIRRERNSPSSSRKLERPARKTRTPTIRNL